MAIGVDDGWSAAEPLKNLSSTATALTHPTLFGGTSGFVMENTPDISPEDAMSAMQLQIIMQNSGVSPAAAAVIAATMPAHGTPHPTKPGFAYSVNTQMYEPIAPPANLTTAAAVNVWLDTTPGVKVANATFQEAIRTDGRTDVESKNQLAAFNEIMGNSVKQLLAANPPITDPAGGMATLFGGAPGQQPSNVKIKPLTVAAVVGALWWLL